MHSRNFVCSAIVLLFGCIGLAVIPAPADAQENWPRWRGPNADGTAAASANPPVKWSQTENVRWKTELPGKGSATPIVWENRIFVVTAIDTGRLPEGAAEETNQAEEANEDAAEDRSPRGRRFGGRRRGLSEPVPETLFQFCVICYDRETGDELWKKVATETVPHEGGHSTNTFASGSPVTDGKHLYVAFGSYGIYCYDLDGNLQWKRDLGRMQTRNAFGEGSSPALHEDTLVVPWDHEGESALYALDAGSGETRWQVARDEPTTWATPLIVENGGRTQVITNGTNRVRSYDLADGSLIWECGGQATNPIPSPVANDRLVYCMTGYQGYAVYAIPLDAKGDVTDSDEIAWSRTDVGPYISSPVLYKGQLYVTKGREGILFSLDAETGETIIGQTRLPGLSTLYASLVAAADRIYITDRQGKTLVIRHGNEFDVLATNDLGETIDATPVFVGDQAIIRGEQHLYCFEQR